MSESILQFAGNMFVGPIWPASLLVCMLAIYTVFALIGLVDLDVDLPELEMPDLDVPDLDMPGFDVPDLDVPDVDADVGDLGLDVVQGIGAATIRWTNFGRVPIVIWGGVFTLGFWTISYMFWHVFDVRRYEPTLVVSTLLTIRNVVLATGIAKVVTQPLIKHFVATPEYDQSRLIGSTCEIISPEATPTFGQAKFRTDAAPLLLNVRTDGAHIVKGNEVRIIGFDPSQRVYQVTSILTEQTS
ncbi:MAG: DUF1449 domain-containing protein [Rubripirellula sp.]